MTAKRKPAKRAAPKRAKVERSTLTERQRRFVAEYLASGNATDAARRAGYAVPNVQSAALVKMSHVAEAIAKGAAKADERRWMTREQRLVLLDRIANGHEMEQALTLRGDPVPSPAKLRDRLKAIELQGKMLGDFVERRELSGPNGGAIPMQAVTEDEALEQLKLHARTDPRLADALKGGVK